MPYHVLENNDNVFRIFMSAVYALCDERHRLFDCSGPDGRAGTVIIQDLDNGQLSTANKELTGSCRAAVRAPRIA